MKILFLNAGYCTGLNGEKIDYIVQCWKNLYAGDKVLKKLEQFIKKVNPDILALDEIDKGSIRAKFINQIKELEQKLGFSSTIYKLKYGKEGIVDDLPIFRNHCNAILTKKKDIPFQFFYLKAGVKRLVLQAKIKPDIDLFLVHLSLRKTDRIKQIEQLEKTIQKSKKVIVTGDFNNFEGPEELISLMRKNKLRSANKNHQPTFPSCRPNREIDYFLVSQGIKIKKFKVFRVKISDHLPIMIEI